MNIIQIAKAIATGNEKARRDIRSLKNFETLHANLHRIKPDFDCATASKLFYGVLGSNLGDSLFERAAYSNTVREWHNRNGAEYAAHGSKITSANFIPFDINGTETEEELNERLERAVANQAAFEEQVSETNDENNKKKGKR